MSDLPPEQQIQAAMESIKFFTEYAKKHYPNADTSDFLKAINLMALHVSESWDTICEYATEEKPSLSEASAITAMRDLYEAYLYKKEQLAKLRTAMLALVGCEESELEQMVVNLRLLIANNVAPSSDIVPSINAVEALIETRG